MKMIRTQCTFDTGTTFVFRPHTALCLTRPHAIRAELLDRFPLEDNKEVRIENGISDFCFPAGLKLSYDIKMPKFFCFVLTNSEGDRTYGNCLIIYEAIPLEVTAELGKLSAAWEERHPNTTISSPSLIQPPLNVDSKAVGLQIEAASTPLPMSPLPPASPPPTNAQLNEHHKPSDAPLPSTHERPSLSKGVFAPKCLCLLSKYPFVDSARAWLMQLYRLSLSPTPIPLERYICNFVLEVPCPVPDKVDIQYTMLDQVITYPSPPRNWPLAWSGISFDPVCEWLSPENLLLIFNCVLLEQQVLLHSTQLSLLTATFELLTAILFPLSWCHVYIPVLPRHCLYVPTNSPVPFLLGFPTDCYRTISNQIPDTVVVVDIDQNQVNVPPGAMCPALPEKRRVKLLQALRDGANLYEIREKHWPSRSIENLDDPFTQSSRIVESIYDEATGTSEAVRTDWEEVRWAFLSFFIALLRDYRKFMVYPTKENPKPRTLFKQHEFVSSHTVDWAAFLEDLCQTQAFQTFIDARLQPDPEDTDIAVFDDAIESKHSRTRFNLPLHRRHTSQSRAKAPETDQEIKTVVALQPDTSGLPSEPFTYPHGFPRLHEAWFIPPRPINELAEYGTGLSQRRFGSRKRKRNNIFRFKSDFVPHDPATLVFSTFVMSYAPTVGRELLEEGVGRNRAGGAGAREYALSQSEGVPSQAGRESALSVSATAQGEKKGTWLSVSRLRNKADEVSHGERNGPHLQGEEERRIRRSTSGGLLSRSKRTGTAKEGEKGGPLQEPPSLAEVAVASMRSEEEVEGRGMLGVSGSAGTRSGGRPRPKMRRLSEDLKEERMHAANAKLIMAFDVLARMKLQSIAADEWIYRSLIDAASRMGNVDLAMKALMDMNEAGFMPDASVMSCLIAGLAMNDKTASRSSTQAVQNLAMLDWNRLRQSTARDPPQRLNLNLDVRLSMNSTPRFFKDTLMAFRRLGTPSSHTRASEVSPSSPAMPNGSIHRPDATARVEATSASQGHNAEVGASKETQEASKPHDLEDKASGNNHTGSSMSLDETPLQEDERALSSQRSRSSANYTAMKFNSPALKYQVLYSESILEMLFPSLVMDTDSETCPECGAKLSSAQIQSGWLADSNNYTTQCPLCTAARDRHHPHDSDAALASRGAGPGSMPMSASEMARRRLSGRPSSARPSLPPQPPPRRFVARFSVHSTAADWVGSTGPGTPLWCEYLSPWVLRKEVQTILLSDGIKLLTSPTFRKTSQASSTIFWNLILWFRQYALPVLFLIQDSLHCMAEKTGPT